MSDHPTVVFLDQVKPGMRVGPVRPETSWPEPAWISQRRDSADGSGRAVVHLIGTFDDGRPFIWESFGTFPVLVFETAPVQ